eukprot:scaffold269734_cov19-Tisochrysis_lutea.AAC.1
MGMKLTGKLNGTLVDQLQLFRMVKGVLSITCPTNAQENDMKSHSSCCWIYTHRGERQCARACLLGLAYNLGQAHEMATIQSASQCSKTREREA